jgi:predicted permease
VNDIRIAIRTLRATPLVTLVVILSLALGIGANTAIFSVVNGLLLRPLPVEQPDRLVLLQSDPRLNPGSPWSNPAWEQIRDHHSPLFQATFAFSRRPIPFDLARGGPTDVVSGIYTSGSYFAALGVAPALGRVLGVEDDRRGGGADGPVAVISHALWQRRFGGSSDAVGRRLTIDRVPFTVVGIMPPGFFGTDVGTRSDLFLPLGTEPLIRGRASALDQATNSSLMVMARLKDGQSIASAEQALRSAQPRIREATVPAQMGADARAQYLATPFGVQQAAGGPSALRGRYREPALIMMAVVALVLLVACANVANVFLARAAARRREIGVRLAIGASRWRLARAQLAESLLLSAAGSLAGIVIARWASRVLVQQMSTQASLVVLDTSLDWRVLVFTASMTVAVALLFSLAPALLVSRTSPIAALGQERVTTGRHIGIGGALVAGQLAVSFVLVVGAVLFLRTFNTLASVDVGFDRDAVLLVRLDARQQGTNLPGQAALYESVVAAVKAIPGVSHAAISEITPVSGMITDVYVEVENGPRLTPPRNIAYTNRIMPDWFATYGTSLLAGRDFDERDGPAATPVTIVNDTLARRMLPDGNPIGRRIRNPSPNPNEQRPWLEVVGVVADANYLTLRENVPATMYLPLAQSLDTRSFSFVTLSVRAANGLPSSLASSVGRAVARIDRDIGLTFTPLKQQVDAALVRERLLAILSGWFSALAILLAALGLYGVAAYTVNRRRAEIGLRMAIGATPARVVRLVVTRIAVVLAVGVGLGAVASLWLSTFIATLIYGLEPRDITTLVSSAVLLTLVGTLAGWLPARRAARIDPARALRHS